MRTRIRLIAGLQDERGVVLIIISLTMVIFIGLAAFAIDIGHIAVVRNELRNAADAGALAGARVLYTSDSVNTLANGIAEDAAVANIAEGSPVEVLSVERGHWSFTLNTFWPNEDVLDLPELVGVTTEQLDLDPNFINAVRVQTGRIDTPASSFFSKIFGYDGFALQAEAVAYIGFAGTIMPEELDQPIGICAESILLDGTYQCNIGRMINSGQNVASSETGGWTDFNQDGNPCQGGTNSNAVNNLVCGNGNPNPIYYGDVVATSGGQIQNAFTSLMTCWENATNKQSPWELKLLVINCPGNNVGTCEQVVGAVTVNIVWITGAGNDPHYNEAPTVMSNWSSDDPDGVVRWNSFVNHFNLKNVDGSPAPYDKKGIYFLPSCEPHIVDSTSGGENFGVLATIPVLVK
ncbi:MAG: TadG family pilus assembly protein [Candidatus Loosdrechtia sp.]|uniref:TadG family pilus assembly protein n=1 Tax=Candidatus Loosdrechtia sp. TaxID=3101272 RepID=UPI003A5FC176|nr:MAG: TadG family pilus assembly protein [Candidatus Jettenia sp. AMX2]